MFWAILGGGAVVSAILLWFLWTLLGWVGLTFGVIAILGVIGVAWYAYVLYGKATDLWNQMEVVGKRVAAIGTLLGEITLPEARAVAAGDTAGRTSPRTPDRELDDDEEFFLP